LLSFDYTKWAGRQGKIVPNVNHLQTIVIDQNYVHEEMTAD